MQEGCCISLPDKEIDREKDPFSFSEPRQGGTNLSTRGEGQFLVQRLPNFK